MFVAPSMASMVSTGSMVLVTAITREVSDYQPCSAKYLFGQIPYGDCALCSVATVRAPSQPLTGTCIRPFSLPVREQRQRQDCTGHSHHRACLGVICDNIRQFAFTITAKRTMLSSPSVTLWWTHALNHLLATWN